MSAKYHFLIGFPAAADSFFEREFALTFSSHAKEACRNDRYGYIIPPTKVRVTKENLVEIEETNGQINKLLLRFPCARDARMDVCMAIIPEMGGATVKTLWKNLKSDAHRTLNRELYEKPKSAK